MNLFQFGVHQDQNFYKLDYKFFMKLARHVQSTRKGRFVKLFQYNKKKYTARKTIFYFSRRPEKMVFPKKLRWNLIFLVLSGNIIFLFPENMILPPDGKWKMIFLKKSKQKKPSKYDIYFKFTEKMDFSKRIAPGYDFSCTIWKGGIFPRKHGIFSLGRKQQRDNLSQEIHGNMIFSIWYVPRLSSKKKFKDDPIPLKYT